MMTNEGSTKNCKFNNPWGKVPVVGWLYFFGGGGKSWNREKDFKRNTLILLFLPQNYLPLGLGEGVMKYLDKKVVLEKKILTHDGRQPIAIGQLSDSGYVKR